MPQQIRLWRISSDEQLKEIEPGSLDLESRLEKWLAEDIDLLGLDLLVIGQQVETDFGKYIDLLCIDPAGDLVIVELKRDRTPREVTAQVLDYASWVEELSARRVAEIAATHLGDSSSLEVAFRSAFDEDLPEVLNEGHRMVVVAAQLDSSTERIIRYLSEVHGVGINAVNFQYFETKEGGEVLGRVFLIEPGEVDRRTKALGSSKRNPNLSREELEEIADESEVGDMYRELVQIFKPCFDRLRTTRSSISFVARWQDGEKRVLNLIPGESGPESGVRFQIYTYRAADIFDRKADVIISALPDGSEDWEYQESGGLEWSGHTGGFGSVSEAERLAAVLTDQD